MTNSNRRLPSLVSKLTNAVIDAWITEPRAGAPFSGPLSPIRRVFTAKFADGTGNAWNVRPDGSLGAQHFIAGLPFDEEPSMFMDPAFYSVVESLF